MGAICKRYGSICFMGVDHFPVVLINSLMEEFSWPNPFVTEDTKAGIGHLLELLSADNCICSLHKPLALRIVGSLM